MCRFDDMRGEVHLDAMGKDYVFKAENKDESFKWFVAIAQACSIRWASVWAFNHVLAACLQNSIDCFRALSYW